MADGSYVERDVLNIVEKIREYDSNLVVKCCTEATALSAAPYALYEKCRDGYERFVFDIWELDERVLERIHAADNMKNSVLVDIDGNNLIVKKAENQRYKEKLAQAQDVIESYLKSPKSSFSFKNENEQLVTIDSQEGRRAKVS